MTGTVRAGVPAALLDSSTPPARVKELAHTAGAVTVEGPGGTGKSVLMRELAEAHRIAGRTVLDLGDSPDPDRLDAQVAVLVDDAHRLDHGDAARVRRLVEHSSASVAVAFRPWPRPAPLTELLTSMGSARRLVVLGHADHRTVAGWARAALGERATPDLVDRVVQQTGGLPVLVHAFLEALATQPGETLPRAVLDLVRAELITLDEGTRGLLHALAAGAPLELDVLAQLLDVPESTGADMVARGRSSGWLLTDGQLIPLARQALLSGTPREVTRSVRRRLLGLLLERGEEPVELARALAADGVRDLRAARVLEVAGSAALGADPALARDLLADAAATGARAPAVTARRAQAAALCGALDEALQLADAVLLDEVEGERARAAAVTATVLARRGLLAQSAELYRLAGDARKGSAAWALLGIGQADEARAVLAGAPASPVPTLLGGAEELMAQGVLESLRGGPDAERDVGAALSTLTRAATLVEPVGRCALLPDTPAAMAALVALHCGELDAAESGLHRALAADVGGPMSRPRHHLLLAWSAMLRGRRGQAREQVRHAERAAGGDLEPRDELYLRALHVGLARRDSDVPALVRAWVRAREAILRHPVDLFALLPLGELVVAGARLGDDDRLAPHLATATALLERLGDPALWATPLHWSGVQAAIITDDPERLRPHAAALVAAARTSPYAAILASAGRTWLRVLTGDIEADAVIETAERLAHVGLAWDGSRLAGQAAARTADPRDRTSLLQCARALTEAHGGEEAPAADAPVGAPPEPHACGSLSEREREVARLVVAGHTYREIGGRLFISAKTVEHHVARIRQRLGASNRSDLLARLRAELTEEI